MQSFESNIQNKNSFEKAVLVGLVYGEQTQDQLTEFMDELEFLTNTAGAKVLKRFTQKLPHPDVRSFVGKGKLEEIQEYVTIKEIDLIVFDDEISPKQQAHIEEALKIKVLDRSNLILDIFARHAQTAQAKTQVEMAQLQYILPRLKGMWTHLERQRGGIGMRGPGEQEIETDRRIIQRKIKVLKDKLEKIEKQNITRRKNRGDMIRVSLVGYTNVGKSTIMNALSKSDVLAENKLFATLDTTVRKVVYQNIPFLLSDTVGFIRKLPTHLIESFKSTLDEVRESDLLLHVVDISHPQYEDQIAAVNQLLAEIEVTEKPFLMVFNKMDIYRTRHFDEFLLPEEKQDLEKQLVQSWQKQTNNKAIFISAINKENFENLRYEMMKQIKKLYKKRYPYKVFQY